MDNDQLLIWWAVLVIVAFSFDIGAYFFLRAEWKKSGVLLTDKLWNQLSDKLGQFVKTWQERLRFARPRPAQTPSSQPAIDDVVEIIPVSVKTFGQVRRVQFSMEMELNTTVNVRIGARQDAGVTVEKREL
jgi:hypothetical protein